MRTVCVDIETTGTIPTTHEIIEIAIIEYDKGKPTGHEFISRVKPTKMGNISESAMAINNIDISNAPSPAQVRSVLLKWKQSVFGDAQMLPMGHNYAQFDKQFLMYFLKDNYDMLFNYGCRDSKIVAQFLIDSGSLELTETNLSSLCKHFNIKNSGEHTAKGDALATIEVYETLCRYYGKVMSLQQK